MAEDALNVQIKYYPYNKFPPECKRYMKNYKALLTTLQMHPCYLVRIYENGLLQDKELYTIIK
jgi:hypothetical protein